MRVLVFRCQCKCGKYIWDYRALSAPAPSLLNIHPSNARSVHRILPPFKSVLLVSGIYHSSLDLPIHRLKIASDLSTLLSRCASEHVFQTFRPFYKFIIIIII